MMEEENKDTLHIRLHVYDTDMTVNCSREDEAYYRKAAKLITDTVNAYAQVYSGHKGKEDLLKMALIDIALRFEKNEDRNDTIPFMQTITKLTSEIETALKK
jgi:cell division protein ZapA